MSVQNTAATGRSQPASRPTQPRRAAIAAFMGGSLEYYDFALFAAASALIFPKLFFGGSGAAVIASFATFGVAYIARPVGAVALSHIGDRFGRKRALILTLALMGAATFLIGCLPTYDQIGVFAPIMLVVLRLLQGFSAGGELAGASSLTMEHAPEGKRGFLSSFSLVGVGIGMLLANLVMIPVTALPNEALYSWGWRVPFLLSVIVFAVGLYIRRGLEEPEIFKEAVTTHGARQVKKVPLFEAFRLNWQGILKVATANLFAVVQTVVTVFGLAYGVTQGIDRTTLILVATVGQAVCIPARPVFGLLSDRIGRKPVFIIGALGSGVLVFPYFAALDAGNVPMVFLVNVALTGFAIACADGAYPAFFSEMFSANVRFTGMAVGLQLGIVVSGFSPTLGSALQNGDAKNWLPVALMTVACSLLATVAALLSRETFRTPLPELGITRQMQRRISKDSAAEAAPADTTR
ncbi:MFS transporter [Pseudarthrobacter sp902506025]|uniref:MFS transporter n=1 Tax=Pseudarthrobacter sp. 902506025 TaxID=3155291 RepID=UPI00345016E1